MRLTWNSNHHTHTVSLAVLVSMVLALMLTGCTKTALHTTVLDKPPSNLRMPSPSDITSSRFKTTLATDRESAWNSLVKMLARSTMIVKLSKQDYFVSFVEIDGFYYKNKLYHAEFPIAVHLERQSDTTTVVYAAPMAAPDQLPKKRQLVTPYRDAHDSRVIALLDRLTAESQSRERWPWIWSLLARIPHVVVL